MLTVGVKAISTKDCFPSSADDEYGKELNKDQKKHLRTKFIIGSELVPSTARLCGIMNLHLHGIGVDADGCPIHSGIDCLASEPAEPVNVVLTNPPFGKERSVFSVHEDVELKNDDSTDGRTGFWVTTKNKQLNYLQHVKTKLKVNGRCAVVVCRSSLPRRTFERSSNPTANVHSTFSCGHFFNPVLVAGRDESRSPFRQKGPTRHPSGTGG